MVYLSPKKYSLFIIVFMVAPLVAIPTSPFVIPGLTRNPALLLHALDTGSVMPDLIRYRYDEEEETRTYKKNSRHDHGG